MKYNYISKLDFSIREFPNNQFSVNYKSPITGKIWFKLIYDVDLINSVRYVDFPLIKNLNLLKKLCKEK